MTVKYEDTLLGGDKTLNHAEIYGVVKDIVESRKQAADTGARPHTAWPEEYFDRLLGGWDGILACEGEDFHN